MIHPNEFFETGENNDPPEGLPVDNSILTLIKALDQSRSPEESEELIKQLAQKGEVVIPELMEHFGDPPFRKIRRLYIVRILHRLGYPDNKSGFNFIVGEASDINSQAWEEAFVALKEVEEYAIPAIKEMLNYYIEDIEESAYYTQGICQFIEEKMKPELRISLLPELLQLLKLGTDENCVDEYALWALRKIGSPQADAVIPILREKILSQRKEYIRCKAIEALADFDPSVVRPLIPVLQDCLQDDSQKIRDSARKILTWLGEI